MVQIQLQRTKLSKELKRTAALRLDNVFNNIRILDTATTNTNMSLSATLHSSSSLSSLRDITHIESICKWNIDTYKINILNVDINSSFNRCEKTTNYTYLFYFHSIVFGIAGCEDSQVYRAWTHDKTYSAEGWCPGNVGRNQGWTTPRSSPLFLKLICRVI